MEVVQVGVEDYIDISKKQRIHNPLERFDLRILMTTNNNERTGLLSIGEYK